MDSHKANQLLNDVRIVAASVSHSNNTELVDIGELKVETYNAESSYEKKAYKVSAASFEVRASGVEKGVCIATLRKVGDFYLVSVSADGAETQEFNGSSTEICGKNNLINFQFDILGDVECVRNGDCESWQKCIDGECSPQCDETHGCDSPCHSCVNGVCELDHPSKTIVCEKECCMEGTSCCAGHCCEGFASCCGSECCETGQCARAEGKTAVCCRFAKLLSAGGESEDVPLVAKDGECTCPDNLVYNKSKNTCECPVYQGKAQTYFNENFGGPRCCPPGHIPSTEGGCTMLNCIGNETTGYECYLKSNQHCGYLCSSTTGQFCNQGFCYAQQCTPYTSSSNWMKITGSYGCHKGDLYCYPVSMGPSNDYTPPIWRCSSKPTTETCCVAVLQTGTESDCYSGSCDAKVCDQFNNVRQGSAVYGTVFPFQNGCAITLNGRKAYCALYYGNWQCAYGQLVDTWAANKNSCYAATSTYSYTPAELLAIVKDNNQTAKSPCWRNPTCTIFGTYGTWEHNKIVKEGCMDGKFACDTSSRCYYKNGSEYVQCGDYCSPSEPDKCRSGLCNESGCPAGTRYFCERNLCGCLKTLDETHSLYCYNGVGTYFDKQCILRTTDSSGNLISSGLCAQKDCNLDGTGCKHYLNDMCVPTDTTTGLKYCLHNAKIENCVCDVEGYGNSTNGYCCPVGESYVTGACSYIECGGGLADLNGQCL